MINIKKNKLITTKFLNLEEYRKSPTNVLIDAYREAVRKNNTFVASILDKNIALVELKHEKPFFKSNKNINGLLYLSETC